MSRSGSRVGTRLPALALAGLVAGCAMVLPARPGRSQEPAPLVHSVDGAGLKKALSGHRGKGVLVNLWATWCGPCVAEFPDLVRLHRAYEQQGLVVLAVSMDEPEDRAKVTAFVKQQQARFPVYLRRGGTVDQFFDPVDRNWSGALPTTFVFGRDGRRIGKPHVGQMSYAELRAVVEAALQ